MEDTIKHTKKNEIVAIIGFAPSSRVYAPFGKDNVDVWGINEEYEYKWWKQPKPNAWFQLHQKPVYTKLDNTNCPTHWAWLQKKHNFPIYLQEVDPNVPSSIRFPIEQIRDKFGNYFTSTLAYLVAYAHLLEYKRIELYGFEMASGTEYEEQAPCALHHIARAKRAGIEVYTPPACSLLDDPGYGYKDVMFGFRQDLEVRGASIKTERNKMAKWFNILAGMIEAAKDAGVKHKELEPAQKTFIKYQQGLNADLIRAAAKIDEISMAMKRYDLYKRIGRGIQDEDES